jgi:hypothetical protein
MLLQSTVRCSHLQSLLGCAWKTCHECYLVPMAKERHSSCREAATTMVSFWIKDARLPKSLVWTDACCRHCGEKDAIMSERVTSARGATD